MKCNKQLSWVQGNDVLLLLWLWERKAVGSGMHEQTTAFVVDEADNLTVTAATGYRGIPLEWKPAESQGANCLIVEMPASMPVGDYALQVKCTVRGRRVRSFESAVFSIVRTNGEANTVLTRIGGARCAETSMEIQFVSSAVARGKNAYELWLEAGNEGTIDDFLNHYIATLATEEEDGLMSHEDKATLGAVAGMEVASRTDIDSMIDRILNGS